jgi:predicted Zn-dependent protease with MMP-like domain
MVRAEEFDRLVAEALDGIPPEFARYLENVAVVVEDEPPPALLRRLGLDPERQTLFGLYEGVPLPRRPHDFAGPLPDHITIFRGPLMRSARTRAELAREVQATVIHELAHFFGLDEHRIRGLGY